MVRTASKLLVELDGRKLEGGGQLIRIALCLSALTSTPVKINHIRGARSGGGGLKAQHLACVRWLKNACNAQVEGAEKGSKTLTFTPGDFEGGLSPAFQKRRHPNGSHVYDCTLDIGTAGSTGLALQAILPYILFTKLPAQCPVHLHISGGTNVSGSPSYEYVTHVLLPTLSRIGYPEIQATLGKRGWSQGGTSIGHFTLIIPPRAEAVLPTFKYRPRSIATAKMLKKPSRLKAIFIAPSSCFDHFRKVLVPAVDHHFGAVSESAGNLEVVCEDSLHDKRMYLIIIAAIPTTDASHSDTVDYVLARDWLYERKMRSHERAATEMAERVTKDLADEWRSGAWVDEHMRDQLVIFQALAAGRSEVYPGRKDNENEDNDEDDNEIEDESEVDDVKEEEEEGEFGLREPSLHARTAEWVAKRMLGVRFDAKGVCEGIAFGYGESVSVVENMARLNLDVA